MYNKPTNIKSMKPKIITILPSLKNLALSPKCIVNIPKAKHIKLLPIALSKAGLQSKTAINKIIKEIKPSIPHIPP